MRDSGQQQTLGIYVSVPFCRAKCSFCNFASGVSSPDEIDRYVARLCAEIGEAAQHPLQLGVELPRIVDTVYLGGGTPSLLTPDQLRRIFVALRQNFDVQSDAEITLEAAPGQIADAVLEQALGLGVDRVSLGVQSFVDRESAAVGRSHTGDSCLAEIARLRSRGVSNVGADLIAGLPYQTEASWETSLQAAIGAEITHLSVYMMEIDEDSRLGREVIAGGFRMHAPRVPDEELVANMYERACDLLPLAGLDQYEISNFAKQGFASRHNRKYWERAPYLGFGLDAHSMLRTTDTALRFANPDDLMKYGDVLTFRETKRVGLREAFEEDVFLRLRLLQGLAVADLRTVYPDDWITETSEAAHELHREGLMDVSDAHWKLTARGRLLSNEVFGHLLTTVAA